MIVGDAKIVNQPVKPHAPPGARRGEQVLQRLRERPPTLWYQGQQITDVTTHPALRGGVETLAQLYDLQWQQPEVSLFESPGSARRVGRSFMIPRTQEDLRSITAAMRVWQEFTHGMMGRSPDYINRAISGYAGGAAFLAQSDPRFGANALRYHEYLRENDLCLSHTLIPPQANRAVSTQQRSDPFIAARVKEETDAGIVIRGCRMLATLPISDEIMVFPRRCSGVRRRMSRTPLAFAFPMTRRAALHVPGEPGLRPLPLRPSAGLALRGDGCGRGVRRRACAVGKRAAVPGRQSRNQAYSRTGAVAHMTHQVVVKNIAKTEFLLGLAAMLVMPSGLRRFSTSRRSWPRSG